MMICVGFFFFFLLPGPLFSTILLASYHQAYVFILLIAIMTAHVLVFNFWYFRGQCFPQLKDIYKRGREHKPFYQDQDQERGQQDFLLLSITSAVTAWVSPCVPWANLITKKSYYFLRFGLTSLLCHCIALICLQITTNNTNMLLVKNPPLIHCFQTNNSFNFSEYEVWEWSNFTICSDKNCLPKI